MPGNKKPKRKHDPRRALRAALRVDERARNRRPLHEKQTRDLGIAYHVSFDLMRSGRGTEETWSALACSMNIAIVMAEQGIGSEHLAPLVRALDGIKRAKERGRLTGRWALDGDAITAIENALAIHDAQLEAATTGEVRAALAEVERRIGKKFGEAPAEVAAEPQRMAA